MINEIIIGIIITVVAGVILNLLLNNPLKKEMIKLPVFKRLFRKKKKLLIYISQGGTCRDPIAKIITLKLLEKRNPNLKLRVEARALGPISRSSVSFAARNAIKELYKEDLLKDFKPQSITADLLNEADLVLVMEKNLMQKKILPNEKTYLFKEFFGQQGDIKDPWPNGRNKETSLRYKDTALEIKNTIENNIDHLLSILDI